MAYEVPRHVHKADGVWKRVETAEDLDAAFKDGWVIDPNTLPLVVLTDADAPAEEAHEPLFESPEDVPAPPEEGDEEPVTEPETADEPKKRGRPRKNS